MTTTRFPFQLRALLAGVGLCLVAPAWAHGSKPHAAPMAAKPAPAEQQDWGVAAPAARAGRTVEILMDDRMRFEPDVLILKQGDTLRLRARNKGQVLHEIVLGTEAALREHAELMQRFPDMEHDEPHMAHIAPGEHGDIVWTFNRPGSFAFACLIPGHFEAGMHGRIEVRATAQ